MHIADDIELSGDEARSLQHFPIVGVGASAGGLEAFSQLLRSLKRAPNMAFVFVQHLDPKHASLLPDLLARETALPVLAATDGATIEQDHVYVIPPNTTLSIRHGRLLITPRGFGPESFMPIDHFFRSLATDQGSNAIAVVMSGGGTDGALGIEDIKGAGGIVFVQSEHSAKHGAMPRSAISTGCVDFVLSPLEIAGELACVGRSLGAALHDDAFPVADDELQRIFLLLRRATAADFSSYKRTTSSGASGVA